LILALALVASLAGPALGAYRLPCSGTPGCCCRTLPTASAATHAAGRMAGDCGNPSPAQPCEWERFPLQPHAIPRALTATIDLPPVAGAPILTAPIAADPAASILRMARLAPPIRSGPPLYLQKQNLLY
jgi:hypothetical protein